MKPVKAIHYVDQMDAHVSEILRAMDDAELIAMMIYTTHQADAAHTSGDQREAICHIIAAAEVQRRIAERLTAGDGSP